jgi:hypothetical protein
MAAAKLAYQIWDDVSGNIIAKFGTQGEAVGFLKAMLQANGPIGVSDLAIIEYPADGSAPVTLLEGADFVTESQVPT